MTTDSGADASTPDTLQQARLRLNVGEPIAAEEHLRRGDLDHPDRLALLARIQLCRGPSDEGARTARTALRLAESRTLPVDEALLALAMAELRMGRPHSAGALRERLHRVGIRSPHSRVEAFWLHTSVLFQLGRSDAVLPILEAVVRRTRTGDHHLQNLCRALLHYGTELRRLQRHEEAAPVLLEATEIAERNQWRGLVARAKACWGVFSSPDEDVSFQIAVLEEVVPELEAVGERNRATLILNNLGVRYLAVGRTDDAVKVFQDAWSRAETRYRLFIGSGLVEALNRAGRPSEADSVSEDMLAVPTDHARARLQALVAGLSSAIRRSDTPAWDERMREAIPHLLHRPEPSVLDSLRIAVETTDSQVRSDGAHRGTFVAGLSMNARAALGMDTTVEQAVLTRRVAAGAPIPLGDHLLLDVLGEGGMGRVWRATHVPTGETRAVKTLTAAAARNAAARAALDREASAMAGLEHPHILPILDRGFAGPATEWATGGSIPDGSPWFSLPMAMGGTLHDRCGQLPWSDVRSVLLAILDALAFAHAHGLLHLDIKPENILLDRRSTPHVPRLADFGLATAIPDLVEGRPLAGTPQYMAPEQFLGQWREWGPRTDLYAIGGTAVTLIQGIPAFFAPDVVSLRAAHLTRPVPVIEPSVPVPSGLQSWVERLMAKSPSDRFPSAAAAAAALSALPDAPDAPGRAAGPATATFDWLGDLPPLDRLVGTAPPGGPADAPTLPVPEDWRTRSAARATGVPALLAHRQVEIMGRDSERDALWRALREAATGHPRVVLLRGTRGLGTRRLMRWMAVRAASLGVARVLALPSGAPTADEPAIRAILRSSLRADGLEGERLRQHLATTSARPPSLSVEHAFRALDGGSSDSVAAAIAGLSKAGPVVLTLPAAERPLRALATVEALLAYAVPVVVVLAVRAEDAAVRPRFAARLADLQTRPDWTTIEVGRLNPHQMRALLEPLVALAPEVTDRLVERSRGVPGYAVRTVRRWVDRGVLRPSRRGLVLPPDLGEDLDALDEWAWLLDALKEDAGEPTLRALELLALLGSVRTEVWRRAADAAGIDRAQVQIERLVAAGLLHRGAHDLMTAPGLADAMRARALRAGRLGALHAAAISALQGATIPGELATLGRTLLAAGDPVAAMEPLRAASVATVDTRSALLVVADLTRAMNAAGIPDDDDRWLDVLGERLERQRRLWDLEEVRAGLGRYQELAAPHPLHRFRAARLHALSLPRGRSAALASVWEAFPEVDDALRRAIALDLVWCLLGEGRNDEAESWLVRATATAGETALSLELASECARRRGEADRALQLASAAAEQVDPNQLHAPAVHAQLGDLHRDAGNLDAARRAYETSLDLARRLGDSRVAIAELNLQTLKMQQGERPSAAAIERARTHIADAEETYVRSAADILGLALLPADELPSAVAFVRASATRAPELARLAELAASVGADPTPLQEFAAWLHADPT